MIALIERCYDAVVADGLAYHTAQPALTKARPRAAARHDGSATICCCGSAHTRKADVLRFLTDPSVPFTNNLAERDGRMIEIAAENLRWLPLRAGRRGTSPLSDR